MNCNVLIFLIVGLMKEILDAAGRGYVEEVQVSNYE